MKGSQGSGAKIGEALRLAREGRHEEARAALQRMLSRDPSDADANSAMGFVLASSGRTQHALHFLERAAAKRPDDATTLVNLGKAQTDLGDLEKAAATLGRAAELDPDHEGALVNYTAVLLRQQRFVKAEIASRAGLARRAGDVTLTLALAASLRGLARADEALALLREATARRPESAQLHSSLVFTMNYVDGLDPAEVTTAHRAYGALLHRVLGPGPGAAARPNAGEEERRLRVGILTAEALTHPVAFFIEPLLERMDRERFEMFVYHSAGEEDATTDRLRAHAITYRNVGPLGPAELDAQLRRDRLDILVELSGHTTRHRLAALRFRPAAVQATYLGYPNTTGVREIDRRIVDSITDPAGADERAVEGLVRLDPCFLCWRPPPDAPRLDEPRRRVAASGGGADGVTFGSFNTISKLNDRTLALWARVLRGAVGSRLLIKDGAFGEEAAQELVRARLARCDIGPERVTLLAKTAGMREHFELYGRVDVALDTFPYNGTTTTIEALYMGVPVVTLEGTAHAGRVGMSILSNVGRSEWIARDADGYVRIATDLARDESARTVWRREGAERLERSALRDEAGFVKRFEAALREMWREACGARSAD